MQAHERAYLDRYVPRWISRRSPAASFATPIGYYELDGDAWQPRTENEVGDDRIVAPNLSSGRLLDSLNGHRLALPWTPAEISDRNGRVGDLLVRVRISPALAETMEGVLRAWSRATAASGLDLRAALWRTGGELWSGVWFDSRGVSASDARLLLGLVREGLGERQSGSSLDAGCICPLHSDSRCCRVAADGTRSTMALEDWLLTLPAPLDADRVRFWADEAQASGTTPSRAGAVPGCAGAVSDPPSAASGPSLPSPSEESSVCTPYAGAATYTICTPSPGQLRPGRIQRRGSQDG